MMQKRIIVVVVSTVLVGSLSMVAAGARRDPSHDLWIHPRGDEAFNASRHYKAPDGELYYRAENDIANGIGAILVHAGAEPRVTAELGADMWSFLERNDGRLDPVIHYDSDGDARVDRTLRGKIVGREAHFEGEGLSRIDWRGGLWQMGIVYRADGAVGKGLDGRYLSSVDSRHARVRFPRPEGLPPVGAAGSPGLVIFKHRGDAPVDLAALARDPKRYLGDFDELTPEEDDDDWTVKEKKRKGRLRTHRNAEDLLWVQAAGGASLDVEWGDMPLQEYLVERLQVEADADGCLSTLESRVSGHDGNQSPVPHRILYCPEAAMVLFDAPDGYQIKLAASVGGEALVRTEASTSILDNIQLYADEVNPRSPRTRSTGTVGGNMAAALRDAGRDVVDMGRHLVTGETQRNIHSGQLERRTPLLGSIPMFVVTLASLKPVEAVGTLVEGVTSGVQVAADGMSAINNAVLNPVVQASVGLAASPAAADTAGHWLGAFTTAWVKNVPFSQRSLDAVSPFALYEHNRAFAPVAYTRTDTQLNIDRVFTLANIGAIYGIASSVGGSGLSRAASPGSGGGSPGVTSAAAGPPPTIPPLTAPPTPVIPFLPSCW